MLSVILMSSSTLVARAQMYEEAFVPVNYEEYIHSYTGEQEHREFPSTPPLVVEEYVVHLDLTMEIDDERAHVSLIAPFRSPLFPTEITLNNVDALVEVAPNNLMESAFTPHNVGIEPFNTNPNLAIHIPSDWFGYELHDLANNQERWYNFNVPANRIVTIPLSYDSGIYDLYLFRLNGASLQLVAYSVIGNGFELIRYLSLTGGTYFLAVAPFVPAQVPHMFTFIIDATSNFDAHELNDSPQTATVFTNLIDIQANLDHAFDEDWFRLDMPTRGERDIVVMNAPAGHYAVFVYDDNLNVIGSFMADGNTRRLSSFGSIYYIRVLSLTGHRVDANYRLIVSNANEHIRFVGSTPHRISIGFTNITINGRTTQLHNAQYRTHHNLVTGRRSFRQVSVFGNLQPYHGMVPFFLNNNYYTGFVVAVETDRGSIHDFDNAFWPMSMFFTTDRSNPGSDNQVWVNSIVILVSIHTGRVVSSVPML